MEHTEEKAGAASAAHYHLKGTPASGLALATWGFFVGFAGVALYGPAAHYFQTNMGISGVLVGLLVAAPQLTGSLLRIPFGAWVDRAGGRTPMLTLLGLSLVGMWGLVYILITVPEMGPRMYPVVLILGFLSGCGVASFSVGIPQASYWYRQESQGTVLGIYGGLGNLAPGIFTLLLPLAMVSWGLAGSYIAWFAFLLVGTGVYAALAHDAYYFQLRRQGIGPERARTIAGEHGQELFPRGRLWHALGVAAQEVRTWGLVVLYFTSFGGFLALTAWFPTYWINLHHMSPAAAGALGGVGFSLLAALVRVAGGVVSERAGGERTALFAFATVFVGATLLTFFLQFSVNFIGELLIAIGMGVGNAAVFKMVPKYVPHAVGGASGWVGGLGALGGFVIPPVLGATVDAMGTRGYGGGFFVYMFLAVVSMFIAVAFMRAEAGRRSEELEA
jgi:NNP family nitrate/nitrite transporter-like MFS transporter